MGAARPARAELSIPARGGQLLLRRAAYADHSVVYCASHPVTRRLIVMTGRLGPSRSADLEVTGTIVRITCL